MVLVLLELAVPWGLGERRRVSDRTQRITHTKMNVELQL